MSDQSAKIKKVFIVSHTHWDREWYQSFQGYRTRLVYLIDELLDHLDRDPDYRHFMMDGQTIVLDDYVEIRPTQQARLLEHVRSGRIAIGPWYVMPDEFLVSGESLIRNLMIGYRRARKIGVEPMKSGYVVDLFGHNSQFPQLMQGFGIDNVLFFRGLGDCTDSEVWWEGADGSRLLGLKLDEDRAYGDFYFFMRRPSVERDFQYTKEEVVERAKNMLDYKNQRSTVDIALALDGIDHAEIEPQLSWMIQVLNEAAELGEIQFEHTSLEAYLCELRKRTGTGHWKVLQGELRKPGFRGVNNFVLANVLSSRIHLKQRNHECETLLEKWAEPWSIFAGLQGRVGSRDFLNRAWEILIENHPHDSICGCSIDQVHRDMLYRFDQTEQIAEMQIKEQLEFLSNHLNPDLLTGDRVMTLFNPAQSAIDGVVEAELTLPAGTDALMTLGQCGGTSFRLFDAEGTEIPYQVLGVHSGSTRMRRPYRDIPHGDNMDIFRIALRAKVPAFGYASYQVRSKKIGLPEGYEYDAPNLMAPVRYPGSLRTGPGCWDNGRIRLSVNGNGTVNVEDIASGHRYDGLLSFEDEADIGEGWNHVAPVANETFQTLGNGAEISTVFDGPLAARIRIRQRLSVPQSIESGGMRRSEMFVELLITTYLDIRKDDPNVYCRTVVNNNVRDHRLKLLLPTGLKAVQYRTNTPFDFVRREVKKPDYSTFTEKERGVVPHSGIVAVDDGSRGLGVLSRGLYEVAIYEDETPTIALTLYRSTRSEVLNDGSDAGQLLRELEFCYAIRPFAAGASADSELWAEHQKLAGGVRSTDRPIGKITYETNQRRDATLPLNYSFMSVDTPELIVSAVKEPADHDRGFIVRLFNVSDRPVQGNLTFNHSVTSAVYVNLDEQPIVEALVSGRTVTVNAGPRKIVTMEVRLSAIGE